MASQYSLTGKDVKRLMKHVTKTDTCWEWMGKPANTGYGQMSFQRDGKQIVRNPHRALYELLVGEIPEGLDLDHLCRNRLCVNPNHLEPVTRKENLMRGDTITAKNAAKTECDSGHEYTEENTYHYRGARQCRSCRTAYQKTYIRKRVN